MPGVRQAAVRIDGGPSRRIVGYVRTIEKSTVDLSATVFAHLRAHLPAHMVPDAIVVVDHLPVTANGKLDRAALPDPPTPPTAPPATVAHAPTPTHQAVHDAWCAVLGVGRVGFDISFFDAGGTSLQLLKLERELAARGVAVSVTDLFRHPTIASLAGQVLGRGANDAERADATDRQAAREARRDRLRSRRGLS